MTFASVYKALKAGKRLRRSTWDAETWMAVINGEFVWSVNGKAPNSHTGIDYLEWRDIDATDWSLVN